MSRSGYVDDLDDPWQHIMWRGAVASALRGARGQSFLKEMLQAMDSLPEPKLIARDLVSEGAVCAMGAVGRSRGADMHALDPEDRGTVAAFFGIAEALAAEIAYENDEGGGYWSKEAPERRFARMRAWIVSHIRAD